MVNQLSKNVGERIRETRVSQERSLNDVASKANVSAATLSRIENAKQGVDLALFLTLAAVLNVSPRNLLDDEDASDDPLIRRIASLAGHERTLLWRGLANNARSRKQKKAEATNVAQQVEELLAQIDFLREELEGVKTRLRRSSPSSARSSPASSSRSAPAK